MGRALRYFENNSPMLESVYPYTSQDWDGEKDAPSGDCQYSAVEATSDKVKTITYLFNDDVRAHLQK